MLFIAENPSKKARKGKKKRTLSPAQRAALKKGQEALRKRREEAARRSSGTSTRQSGGSTVSKKKKKGKGKSTSRRGTTLPASSAKKSGRRRRSVRDMLGGFAPADALMKIAGTTGGALAATAITGRIFNAIEAKKPGSISGKKWAVPAGQIAIGAAAFYVLKGKYRKLAEDMFAGAGAAAAQSALAIYAPDFVAKLHGDNSTTRALPPATQAPAQIAASSSTNRLAGFRKASGSPAMRTLAGVRRRIDLADTV